MAPDPHETSETGSALHAAGLRVSATRVAVLSELRRIPHATADQVETEVRARLGAVSTQAVYDVLAALERVELVRRIEPAGHAPPAGQRSTRQAAAAAHERLRAGR